MKPTILFLFNSSTYAMAPWIRDGRFNVVTVDYDDTDHSEAHWEVTEGVTRLNLDLSKPTAHRDVLWKLAQLQLADPSLVVSFPPCTDLAVSGAKHFASKLQKDPDCQHRAVRMARLASQFRCPYIVENPVSVLSTLWRKPEFISHPWEYAGYCPEGPHPEFPEVIPEQDRYNKKTCYWTGGGFQRPEAMPLEPIEGSNPGWARLGGKSARTKYIRSLTPRGFSKAIYSANCGNIIVDGADNGPIMASQSQQLELDI